MDAALMFFFGLWALLGGRSSSTSSTSSRPWPETQPPSPAPAQPTNTSAPPWPQVVPAGLPPFPGSGWQYDEPPPPEVRQRAGQLVSQLWARGSGAFKVEQTAGRWIAYRAEVVASGKKGVVAYRQKATAAAPQRPQVAPAAPVRPQAPAAQTRPQAQPVPAAPVTRPQAAPRPPVTPTSSPATSSPAPVAVSPVSLPVLRYGDGLKPQAPNPNVALLQRRLGITPDGQFGSGTRTAVIEFQRKTGLAPNQTNAQLLARGFGVVKEATWTKLFATQQG